MSSGVVTVLFVPTGASLTEAIVIAIDAESVCAPPVPELPRSLTWASSESVPS